MNPQLQDAAMASLLYAWAWQWVGIVGVGALPRVLRPWLPPAWAAEAKRIGALCGLSLCILSVAMLVDTVKVEMQSTNAFESHTCLASEVPSSRWERLDCAGEKFWVEVPVLESPLFQAGKPMQLTVLPHSRLVVDVSEMPR
ncbi:hypothetical protein D3C71_21640 [compost metagenome]